MYVKRISILIVLVVLTVPVLGAATDLFRLGMTARPLGMGKVTVASMFDSNAAINNPAALASNNRPDLSSLYSNLAGDVDYLLLAGKMKSHYGTFGMGILSYGMGEFLSTSRDPITGRIIPGATFDYSSQIFVLSTGQRIRSDLSLGASVNLYRERFTGTNSADGSGTTLSLGLLYEPDEKLKIGVLSRNLLSTGMNWSTSYNAPIPMVNKVGVFYPWADWLNFALELENRSDRPLVFSGGVEWWVFRDMVQLRLGAYQMARTMSEVTTNPTAGIGFSIDGINFDYSYNFDTELEYNSTHFFSISLGERKEMRAEVPEAPKAPEAKPAEVPAAAPATPEAQPAPLVLPSQMPELVPPEKKRLTYEEMNAVKRELRKVNEYIFKLNNKLYVANKKKDSAKADQLMQLIDKARERKQALEDRLGQ